MTRSNNVHDIVNQYMIWTDDTPTKLSFVDVCICFQVASAFIFASTMFFTDAALHTTIDFSLITYRKHINSSIQALEIKHY